MSKLRTGLLILCAGLGTYASIPTSALASTHAWEVEEGGGWKALGAGETRDVKSEGGTQRLTITGGIEITCSSVEDLADLFPEGAGLILHLFYHGCKVVTPTGCGYVASPGQGNGLILITNLSSLLVLSEEKIYDEVKENPTTKEFVTLDIETAEGSGLPCGTLKLTQKITGSVLGLVNNTTESLEFTGKSGAKKLKIGVIEAQYSGIDKQKLTGGGQLRAGPGASEPAFKGPSWQFEGARLGAGEEKAFSTSGGTFKIRSITGEVKIECTGASGSGDILGSANEKVGADKHNKLEFTGCSDKVEKGCEIVSFANGETEERAAGKIGPVSVSTELVFPGNTSNRTVAGDLFIPLELNTVRFGAGAPETVFVVLELKKKGAEECKFNGKRFSLLAAPAGGPVAELKIAKHAAKAGEQAEAVELSFPASQFAHVERWTGATYKIEPIEFQWINESKALQTLEIEGTLTLTMTGKKFGWNAT